LTYRHFDCYVRLSVFLVDLDAIQKLMNMFGVFVHVKEQQDVNAALATVNQKFNSGKNDQRLSFGCGFDFVDVSPCLVVSDGNTRETPFKCRGNDLFRIY
jgi:hypothetical protein